MRGGSRTRSVRETAERYMTPLKVKDEEEVLRRTEPDVEAGEARGLLSLEMLR